MGFNNPVALWGLLGVVPIVAMYLLKKEYEEHTVASTYLWSQTLNQLEASKPWQKYRNNLLLLLQLLAFIAGVLYLSEPNIGGSVEQQAHRVIIMDVSASMTWQEGNSTRMGQMKASVLDEVKAMDKRANLTLMTMADGVDVIYNQTVDLVKLKHVINNIEGTSYSDDIEKSHKQIESWLSEHDGAYVTLYTDHVMSTVDEAINTIEYVKVGKSQDNVSVTMLGHQEFDEGSRLMTHVRNQSSEVKSFDVLLKVDGKLLDVQEMTLGAMDDKYLTWNLPSEGAVVEVQIDVADDYDFDNRRYHVLTTTEVKKVLLISEGNVFLEKALGLMPHIEVYKTQEDIKDLSGYDLYVYDGIQPESYPLDGEMVFFNPTKASEGIQPSALLKAGELDVVDDALFKHVDFDFNISEMQLYNLPQGMTPTLLVDNKVMAYKGTQLGRAFYVFGFDLHNTDLPLRIGFPILIHNLIDEMLNTNTQAQSNVYAGEKVDISLHANADHIKLETAYGEQLSYKVGDLKNGFMMTETIGVYKIEQFVESRYLTNYFVVNIDPEESIMIEKSAPRIAMTQGEPTAPKAIGSLLLWLLVAMLLGEWVVYNRGN